MNVFWMTYEIFDGYSERQENASVQIVVEDHGQLIFEHIYSCDRDLWKTCFSSKSFHRENNKVRVFAFEKYSHMLRLTAIEETDRYCFAVHLQAT